MSGKGRTERMLPSAAQGTRQCCARGCYERIPVSALFCARHWSVLPRRVKMRIFRHYKAGQHARSGAMTDKFVTAVHEAVNAVSNLERRRGPISSWVRCELCRFDHQPGTACVPCVACGAHHPAGGCSPPELQLCDSCGFHHEPQGECPPGFDVDGRTA